MFKKFVSKVLIFALVIGIISESFCLLVDPYNIFHRYSIRDNGVELNKNYLKMRHILDNPEMFDGFLFGSSRVGSIHFENVLNQNTYNMTYSEGVPYEHLANIKTFIENGIIPKRIYLSLDSLSYTIDPLVHKEEPIRSSYEVYKDNPLKFFGLYLDPAVISQSIPILLEYENDDYDKENWIYNFYHYGYSTSYGGGGFDEARAFEVVGHDYRMDETLEEIKEIVDICKEYDIELTVFTNPMYYVTYEASLDLDYLEFLRRLADITPFYNFSGYSYISTNSLNYNDPSHYNAEVGDILIDMMVYKSDLDFYTDLGFGYYTNSDNVEELINRLINSREIFLKEERWP